MLNLEHPDIAHDWEALKALKRGSRQAADDAAMDAMWEALEEGKSKEEANKIFSDTYNKVAYGKQESTGVPNTGCR